MRFEFDWDSAKAKANIAKHDVTFDEAMSVFLDPMSLSRLDDEHGANEERWVTLGESRIGKLIVIVHTWRELAQDRAAIRIISARRPTKREARQYREGTA